jgi:hypothetical protein
MSRSLALLSSYTREFYLKNTEFRNQPSETEEISKDFILQQVFSVFRNTPNFISEDESKVFILFFLYFWSFKIIFC